jgi:UPF0755 protein
MRFLIAFLAFIITFCVFLGAGAVYVGMKMQEPGPLQAETTLVIPRGTSAAGIAVMLERQGIVASHLLFRIQHRLDNKPDLKAGEYLFAPHVTMHDIIAKLAKGEVVIRKVSIPEGLTSADIVRLLQADIGLSGTIDTRPPEGSLLPDTYRYTLNDSRAAQVARMQKAMQDQVMTAWAQRDADTPLQTPEQLVTLASIVEKETGVAAERSRVAGVYINRLRRSMLLQSDPTVIYGLTMGDTNLGRALTFDDLKKPTPYNTYVNTGLPPGPIANPGAASLMAAAKPEKHDLIYFVADGTGGHRFAATLDEHNRNVAQWRQLNKEAAGKDGEKRKK